MLISNCFTGNKHNHTKESSLQAKLFQCRKNEEVFDLNIGDELIKPVSLVKLLGDFIDDNLSFNEHVSTHDDVIKWKHSSRY